ncbi:UbiH/UbiF/VisC/COQ6 family ubiquinone biosynthesis hydroxylase [Burkholderia vietnamiensis]|jgi:2-octaprenyl-6-methoxyphenol hydroxylase|uniref:UbiH/UbiF/VisC/COQ6 family ubiquinone biosynthesis hydroxylase n=1 Tax=Burkholderia vietnamiensis TaxID=60552 RepID=UPI00075D4D81|nr:UbiH/UbiF/VisC/COQ6 family ubiquinone biosynthesis hydroxylase [Burkholderia vietnamiensis]KVS03967.1 2-polyprenyl-6-methoxyphenol 4-hydroxylase [Burkholderia vietnamiensis]MBR8189832.1 UbiH/UbiF/VisC/COQ6 family ubiquinone biosynthesis hydroxylase [Burkholderia vietnamiensis]MBR8282832.1 UbiH/UbiF/VisC/COQ6 family ubiquinone biosynthesis hydroxylase [Burkholderia vietnamiensis]MCA7987587.1 UbiH/UbiF/VisC/COQ6 family ubiquinone biosynthesis hydroxylase [Burkholderia vietnamiensis]MDN7408873
MTTASSPATPEYDLAIVGAGPVGLALAGWLARRSATQHASIALIDAREPAASANDPRAIAVSHGSRVLLDTLGWPADATPIEHIHVSQRGHFGRTLIDRDEHDVAALGYVVRYGSIVQTLARAVHGTRVDWLTSTTARAPQQDADGVTLTLDGPHGERTLRARIVINAEGGLFHERQADADKHRRDYGQTAIVGTVTVSSPRPNVAWERFTHEGPLALLPLGGPRQADYALVWCCAPDEAARRVALPDDAFLHELGSAFGERMGRFVAIAARASFPLGLAAAQTLVNGRVAIVGNAAQTLHPVAGQGLNLGLRDAHTLVDAVSAQGFEPTALAAFNARRALDRRFTIGATDTLARLFTVDAGPLPLLRGAALTALEFVPPLKKAIARQMMFGQRS